MSPKTITVIGSLNTDLVSVTARVPSGGETLTGTSFHTGAGGKGANQAVAAARLSRSNPHNSSASAPKGQDGENSDVGIIVKMVGAVGNDEFGPKLIAGMKEDGIDVSGIEIVKDQPTGVAVIIVEAGPGTSGLSIHIDMPPSMNLSGCYSPGPSRFFEEPLQLSKTPLVVGGAGKGKIKSGTVILAQISKVYSKDGMEWDRSLLLRNNVQVSDDDLNHYFNPWHRESRAYERIDECIKGSARTFFPKYFGAAKLPYSCCPTPWRQANSNESDVCMVVLGLLDQRQPQPQPQPCQDEQDLRLSDESLISAKKLHSDLMDPEYIHVFIHLCEMIETLHKAKIIHADLKEDILIDLAIGAT
ncbi:hypothetical protein IFR05_004785 [Cadophora sp. M221]|nr:hypothetical protein IFR05_004785 [Cadophora sp. M221]